MRQELNIPLNKLLMQLNRSTPVKHRKSNGDRLPLFRKHVHIKTYTRLLTQDADALQVIAFGWAWSEETTICLRAEGAFRNSAYTSPESSYLLIGTASG